MITSANKSDELPDAERLSTTREVYPDVDTAGCNVDRDRLEQRQRRMVQRIGVLNWISNFAERTASAAQVVRRQGRLMLSYRPSPSAVTMMQSPAALLLEQVVPT